ncbi:hypothetical protein LINGRAHAP2_LOCUS2717, partial [Linum grandiflorum]
PAPIYLLSHLQSPPLPPASPCIPHRHTVSHALDPRRPPSTPPTISSRPHPKRSTPFPQFSPLGGNFRYSSVVSSAILEKCDSEINNYICAAYASVGEHVDTHRIFAGFPWWSLGFANRQIINLLLLSIPQRTNRTNRDRLVV